MVLHVGLPKSGTTFLQRSLDENAEALGDRGVLYPQTRNDVMFRAALDVRGNHKTWGRKRKQVEGAWDELCCRARKHVGTTVISHELLAAASRHQIDAAYSMLKGLDVHLVVTARDLARQLVAEWQEGVKHGRRASFAEFQASVSRGEDDRAQRFHAAQDLPDVLDRWGRWLPPENVHVVAVPPPGSDQGVLWDRFASAVGFDPTGFPPVGARDTNGSLGVDQIALLRRVNQALDGRLQQPSYGRLVKHRLAQDVLASDVLANGASARPQLPRALYVDLVPVGEAWEKEIRKAGYVVHGDLGDLVPTPPDAEPPHPDVSSLEGEVEAAATAIAELLLDLEAARSAAAHQEAKRRTWKRRAKRLTERLSDVGT